MKRVTTLLGAVILVFLVINGCEKDNPTSYQEGFSAINFQSDSTSYSFLGDSSDAHVQEVPVRIIGDSTNQERSFDVEIVRDSLTTAEPSDYEIQGGVIKAGQFEGNLLVMLYNTEKISNKQISLHLKTKSNEMFKAGTSELDDVTIYWTNKIIVPSWTLYQYFFCQYPSTRAYRIILQTTGVKDLNFGNYFDYGGPTGLQAKGRKFGNYIKGYNKNHPNNHLKHDDGPHAGDEIEPIYYSKSYD